MISLKGGTIIDVYTIEIIKSTHLICLNCGTSAENYSASYCKICFSRNNWGNVEEFTKLLDAKEMYIFNEEDPLFDEKLDKIRKTFKTVSANSYYGKFLIQFNKIKNTILDYFNS